MIVTPKDFTPRPYQKILTDFFLDNERCGGWSSMGTGKTPATLNALDTLQLLDDRPVLVVAPKRVATTTWPDEVRKWNHLKHITVLPITGDEKARIRALKYDANIYTINFEQLPWLVEFYGDRWPFSTVVIDEATKLKGFRLRQGTQRAKALGRVAHTKIKRLIELTGTPAPNGLIDLWGQAWFLDKGERLGRTFDAFKQRWFQKSYDGFGVTPHEHAQDQIQRALRDICLTIDAKDWFDLKEPIVNNIYIDLPAKARAHYEDMEKRMYTELAAEKSVEALGAAVKTMRCLHLAGGFSFYGDQKEWMDVHDAKIAALEDIIEEAAGMPVLVAYQWVPTLARMQKAFPDGILLSTNEGLRRAQAGEGRVWFGHPASMGHGVDGLQEHSNIMVYFDHWWNLEERLQVLERIGPTRQMQAGKDRPMFVHNLIARDTVDVQVIERTETKKSVQDILLAAMKAKGYA
jgi:SNF2 family DNA or RNA helicase